MGKLDFPSFGQETVITDGSPSKASLDDWYDKAWDADARNDKVFNLPDGWTVGGAASDKIVLVDTKATYAEFICFLKSHTSVS